ncbi:DUF4149 domain-containing protein [Neisseria sp. N95_16]|uniref:DUF4149 domain-containing protein n=1 Tax=Neisseria brasiliensis TaxID=2666100 RepID=A0A7X2H007_9NEIS|nr:MULTISPECIES: DUF4149 domain-containing protein [Neisseria]MRN39073.1 DUF4149 domain-containing protein [Neisseria brasiliensis]PJO09591.1 DUF4149 domain-containing protein [Neisseria sp. N95_16]
MNKLVVDLAGIWLGMQVMAGYVAAPVLFKSLPKLQAGAIAGELFNVVSYTGLVVWALVYFVGKRVAAVRNVQSINGKLIAVLWLGLAANQFLVTPVIEAHKTQTTNWLLSLTGGSFGMWHGISSLIYMICAILALVLVWRISALEWK